MTGEGIALPDDGKAGSANDAGRQPGTATLSISNAIVHLVRSHAGRGPTKARTTITSELVVVTLRDCLTVAETSLANNGHEQHVKNGRHALHHGIRDAAIAAVEEITGRRVAAYLTDQHHDPDVAVMVFLFTPPSRLTTT